MKPSTLARATLFPAILAAASAAPASGQDEPPPAAAEPARQAQEAGVHTVRRGDTLWDLAARYLSNPREWRSIFEQNPGVVEDPHWIYPGERIRITGGVQRVDRARVERAEDYLRNVDGADAGDGERGKFPAGSVFRGPEDEGPGLSTLSVEERPPLHAFSADDLRRAPFLVPAGTLEPLGRTVRVMEENPLGLRIPTVARQNLDVIIALEGLDAEVGDSLLAVRLERTEAGYGSVVVPRALLAVKRRWSDSARAIVVRSYADYETGDRIVPAPTYDLDAGAPHEPAGGVELEGRVIAYEMRQPLLGPGDFVFLDVGADAGVRPGDEFAVLPRAEDGALSTGDAPDLENDAITTLRVIRVVPGTSTARVVHVRDPGVRPGDVAHLVRRLSVPTD